MKRYYKLIFSFVLCIVFIFGMSLPSLAAISNLDDTVVVDRVYCSSSSDYLSVQSIVGHTYSPGDTVENNGSFLSVSVVPNYFYEQFNVYSSTGLPIADSARTYSFILSNFYSYIDSPKGVKYLKSVDRVAVSLYYSDGSNSSYSDLDDAEFVYSSDSNTNYIQFNISPSKPVLKFHLRYYYSILDFGLSFLNSNSDVSDYIYYIGTRNFKIEREEVFPSTDSTALNDYAGKEKELIDATSGGMQEFQSVTNNLDQAFLPSSSIYRGAMFFGNIMSDIVGTIPDLNMIILVSLAIGIVMVVLGSVLFSMGAGSSGKRVSKSKPSSNTKTKGGKGG